MWKQFLIASVCVLSAFLFGLLAGVLIRLPGNGVADMQVLAVMLAMLCSLIGLFSLALNVDLDAVRRFQLPAWPALSRTASRLFNAALFREATKRASLGERFAAESRKERAQRDLNHRTSEQLDAVAAATQREYLRDKEAGVYDDAY